MLVEVHIDPIGLQRRFAAVEIPMIELLRIFQEVQQKLFVIALEEVGREALWQTMEQRLDDTAAVGAAVDIVTQKNQCLLCGFMRCSVVVHHSGEPGQEIGPPMNVPNGIHNFAVGHCRGH